MSASHDKRPDLRGVVQVTQKISAGLPGLRTRGTFSVIKAALRAGNHKAGFRVVAFSVLSFTWAPPVVWGLVVSGIFVVLLRPRMRAVQALALIALVMLLGQESGSPSTSSRR